MGKFPKTFPVEITPDFCVGIALMVLVLPLKWVISWFIAASFHELCHIFAIRWMKIPICSAAVSFSGAVLKTGPMNGKEEFICALAGPVGGLSLLLLFRWMPMISICAFIQSGFNLLPVFPLDGGRALRSFLIRLFREPFGRRLSYTIETGAVLALCFLGWMAAFVWDLGIVPLIAAVILLIKNIPIKTACNQALQRVQ